MKKNSLKKMIALLALFIGFSSMHVYAQDSKSTSVTGEILDMNCYMAMGAHGDGHKSCAASCINSGGAMGLLTSDGKVYLLVENHDKKDGYNEAKKHAGEQVTVTGTMADRGGLQAVVVDEVKAKS